MTFELTNLGRQILLKAAAGETEIVFTKMQIGDGAKQNPLTATALKSVKIDNIAFTKFQSGIDFATLTAVVSNSELNSGFRITEAGVFVKDPNSTTNEILYAVGFEDSQTADYVPSKSERLIDLQFDIAMYIGTAENISATLADALGYNPGVGKSLAGKTVTPTKTGVSVTAGEGAEIFNDYREQTQTGLVKQGNLAIGEYSSAHGSGTTAGGKCSSAGGSCTQANGEYSKANGLLTVADGYCSSSEGQLTIAYGDNSHAEGAGSCAKGKSSHTEGNSTTSSGENSHAEGKSVTALGDCSHAEGKSSDSANSDYTNETANDTIITAWDTDKFTLAKGVASHAEGKDCLALGDNSHAEGNQTTASGEDSHAEGYETTASGAYSHAEGLFAQATGDNSHAEGSGSTASGVSSHAEGASMARGDYSHAKGSQTTAFGDCSCAEGESYNLASEDYTYNTNLDNIIEDWKVNRFSLARGKASHCEGTNTLALGDRSHSMGIYTIARGVNSFAGGYFTVAKHIQFVTGKYNTQYNGCEKENGNVDTESQLASQSLFIIGNGTSEADSNAFRVSADGQCYGLKAFSAQGADFAEYFEWADGNPDNEDRRGKFVTLDGDKIKLANDGDYVLGIVTGSGAFIGNGQSENWHGKYLKDIYGDIVTEETEIPESTDENTGEVIPAHTVKRFALNPEYNPNSEYVSREFRKEWSPVGMLGQIILADDGTCTVNGYCKPSVNGVGTASDSGYRVLKRLDESHIKVLVK